MARCFQLPAFSRQLDVLQDAAMDFPHEQTCQAEDQDRHAAADGPKDPGMVACLTEQIVEVQTHVDDQRITFEAAVIELARGGGDHARPGIVSEPAGRHVLGPGGTADRRAQTDAAIGVVRADADAHDIVGTDDGEGTALPEVDTLMHAGQFDWRHHKHQHAAELAVVIGDSLAEIQHFAFGDPAGQRFTDEQPVVGMVYMNAEMLPVAEVDATGSIGTCPGRVVAENQLAVWTDQSQVFGGCTQQREILGPLVEFGDPRVSILVDRYAVDDSVHRTIDVVQGMGQFHREGRSQIAAVDQAMLERRFTLRPDQPADKQPHHCGENNRDGYYFSDEPLCVTIGPSGKIGDFLGFAHAMG